MEKQPDSLDRIGDFIESVRRAHAVAAKRVEAAAWTLEETLIADVVRRLDVSITQDGKLSFWCLAGNDHGITRDVSLREIVNTYADGQRYVNDTFDRAGITRLAESLSAEAKRLMALPLSDGD